ncbi:MAG: class I SAM-dependent methyltransferase [Candidatus Solibacter sp.]|nr:class I SAM-dependent methyltransferase [Candidatus Solibacter sp.]
MPRTLREAWAAHIAADDYERHMAATGQPQANADLLAELFRDRPPAPGARILFAGAGTGQYFDFWAPDALAPYRPVFTDTNPLFLARLAERFAAETHIDDIEAPRIAGPFDLAIVILVLEHVDWRRAVAAMTGIARRVFTVTQENPAGLTARPLPGTLGILQAHPPRLLERAALIAHIGGLGFTVTRTAIREVVDGKKMVALDFTAPEG